MLTTLLDNTFTAALWPGTPLTPPAALGTGPAQQDARMRRLDAPNVEPRHVGHGKRSGQVLVEDVPSGQSERGFGVDGRFGLDAGAAIPVGHHESSVGSSSTLFKHAQGGLQGTRAGGVVVGGEQPERDVQPEQGQVCRKCLLRRRVVPVTRRFAPPCRSRPRGSAPPAPRRPPPPPRRHRPPAPITGSPHTSR
jgi:hypothetical protein